jgi:hypothetical protein
LTTAIFVRGHRWNAGFLVLLILLYAADAIISALPA